MHEVIARYEHMCDGSMQLPCLPTPFSQAGGSSEGQADRGLDRGAGPGGGGEDVMEASISYCGRLVFTAKFPRSIHGHGHDENEWKLGCVETQGQRMQHRHMLLLLLLRASCWTQS